MGKPETADLVSLMWYALHEVDRLISYAEQVHAKLATWMEDFELTPFREAGGIGKACMVFGKEPPALVRELREALGD